MPPWLACNRRSEARTNGSLLTEWAGTETMRRGVWSFGESEGARDRRRPRDRAELGLATVSVRDSRVPSEEAEGRPSRGYLRENHFFEVYTPNAVAPPTARRLSEDGSGTATTANAGIEPKRMTAAVAMRLEARSMM